MALYDDIRKNLSRGPGGQLSSTSGEELQNASQALERPTVPTVPSEAAAITANPDVAKMAGTPANLQNAVRQSVRKEMDRATVERTQAPSKVLSPAQKQQEEQAKQLQENIKDLPARVQKLSQTLFQNTSQQALTPGLNAPAFDAERPPTMNDADWETAKGLATSIAAGTASTSELARLQNMLGKPIDGDTIKKWVSGPQEAVANAIATALPDTASLAEVYPEPEKMQAIAEALGVPLEQVQGMSFKQFQDAVKGKQAKDFSDTEALRRQAVDPSLSPAERDAARRALKDAGASGLSSIERDVAKVEDRIASGDQIMFNGQSMGIEEALSDDNLKGTIKRYFEEPDFAAKLAASEPDLTNLIENNKEYFQQQAAKIEPVLAEFTRIQEANSKLNDLGNGLKVSDDIMKQLIPEWGTATSVQLAEPPIVSAIKQFGEADKATLTSNINKFAPYPELVNELKAFDANALLKEGFLDKGKDGQPSTVDTLLNTYQDFKSIENMAPQAATTVDVQNLLGAETLNITEEQLDDYWTLINLGQDKDGQIAKFMNVIDSNRDGKPDAPGEVIAKAKELISGGQPVNLKSLLARGIPNPEGIAKSGLGSAGGKLADNSVKSMVDKFKDVLNLSGTVKADGASKLSKMPLEDLLQFESLTGKAGPLSDMINNKAEEKAYSLIPSTVTSFLQSGNFSSGDLTSVGDMYNQLKAMEADPAVPQIVKDKFKERYYQAAKMEATYHKTANNAKAVAARFPSNPSAHAPEAMKLIEDIYGIKKMGYVNGKFVTTPQYLAKFAELKSKLNKIGSGSQNKEDVEFIDRIAKYRNKI